MQFMKKFNEERRAKQAAKEGGNTAKEAAKAAGTSRLAGCHRACLVLFVLTAGRLRVAGGGAGA